jgi:thymidylate synthase
MKQYLDAVREILTSGTRKESRTGVDTISTFNINYEVDLRDGFPLLTTKEINWKNIVAEVLWFLSGDTKIDVLQKHGCKFWDAWADKDGLVPSAYGNFWRQFPTHQNHPGQLYPIAGHNDQIKWAVEELMKNPMSRRVVISAWAPGNAQTSKLPPCHIVWVLNVQNLPEKCAECSGTGTDYIEVDNPEWTYEVTCKSCRGLGVHKDKLSPHLCLHLTQRSCDIALGVPYNIATYALLLSLISKWTGIKPGIFAHTLVDAHAYTCKPDGSMADMDHVPGLKLQRERVPKPLPTLTINGVDSLSDVDSLLKLNTEELMSHFVLTGYNPHPKINFKVAV